MRAGPLRHFVTFEDLVVTQDSDGNVVEDWVSAFDGQLISAEISPLSARELLAAQAVQSEVNGRIKVRYRPGIKASMRAVHRGLVYNIAGPIPDPGSGIEWLTLLTSQGVNEG